MYTIYFSNDLCRVIRLTSPTLNHIIIGGALLMYVSVIIEFIPSTKEAIIKAQCIVSTLP